jgi:hypothetical protein
MLPKQFLGPLLKGIKLYLCRFSTFSGLKFSGLNDQGFGYNSGIWCVYKGARIHVVPFGTTSGQETKI